MSKIILSILWFVIGFFILINWEVGTHGYHFRIHRLEDWLFATAIGILWISSAYLLLSFISKSIRSRKERH
jgi:hypothetical protein